MIYKQRHRPWDLGGGLGQVNRGVNLASLYLHHSCLVPGAMVFVH